MQRQQNQGRSRAGLFLLGSILLAVFAAAIVYRVIKQNQDQLREAQKPKETTDVVIATHDLMVGMAITAEDVKVVPLAPSSIPAEGTYSLAADLVGRTPRERILADEPVRIERIARPDAGVGLNAIVQPSKRAMTVATNTEDAVAGLLQPGNYVDIIVTIKPEDPTANSAKWVTDTILQAIKVLAVGGALDQGNAPAPTKVTNQADGTKKVEVTKKDPKSPVVKLKPSITLEVTPDEAEKLALAVAQGDIYVVLRSDIDTMQYANEGVKTSRTLIPGLEGQPVETPKKIEATAPVDNGGPRAIVIQGSSRTDVQFNPSGTTESASGSKRKNK